MTKKKLLHFRSKEEVYAEVILKEIAGLKTTIRKAIEKNDDPYNKFTMFVGTRINYGKWEGRPHSRFRSQS